MKVKLAVTGLLCSAIAIALVTVMASNWFATETEDDSSQVATRKPPVAKSHKQLGELVCAAIDDGNYETLSQLMAPLSMVKELGGSEIEQKRYAAYISRLPELAKRYRRFLGEEGLLPLKGKPLEEVDELKLTRETMGGKTVRHSTGIRIVRKEDKNQPVFEIVDMAIEVDGRWYVAQLCTEGIERKLMPAMRRDLD